MAYEEFEIRDPLFKEFLGLMKKRTARTYSYYFRKLLEFDPTITGAKMLEEKEKWERTKILLFKNYLAEKGYSLNAQNSMLGCVMGFFTQNRKRLELTRTERKTINETANETEGYFFTKEDIARLWSLSTVTDLSKWVLCNKTFGLRASDFSKITFGELRQIDLTLEAPIFFKKMVTGKEKIIANLFLDSDVIQAVTELLGMNKDKKDTDRVFPHRKDFLSTILQRLSTSAQINGKGKTISFHALRRFLYSNLCSIMSTDKANVIIGKAVKESSYIDSNPATLKEDFKRVLPLIQINGNGIKKELSALNTTTEILTQKLAEKDAKIKELEEKLTQQNQNTSQEMTDMKTLITTLTARIEKLEPKKEKDTFVFR